MHTLGLQACGLHTLKGSPQPPTSIRPGSVLGWANGQPAMLSTVHVLASCPVSDCASSHAWSSHRRCSICSHRVLRSPAVTCHVSLFARPLEEASPTTLYLLALRWGLGHLTGFIEGEVPQTVIEGVFDMVLLRFQSNMARSIHSNLEDIAQVHNNTSTTNTNNNHAPAFLI